MSRVSENFGSITAIDRDELENGDATNSEHKENIQLNGVGKFPGIGLMVREGESTPQLRKKEHCRCRAFKNFETVVLLGVGSSMRW